MDSKKEGRDMYGIVLVSHGLLAKGLVDATKLIVGDNELNFVGLYQGHDLDYFKNEVKQKILDQKNAFGEVIVLTDLMYGTPFNVVSCMMADIDFLHYTGINLPLLLEIVTSHKTLSLEAIRVRIEEEKNRSIVCVNDLLEEGGV